MTEIYTALVTIKSFPGGSDGKSVCTKVSYSQSFPPKTRESFVIPCIT